MQIIRAEVSDAEALTKLCFASKQVWGYPDEYMSIWKEELTITPKKIIEQPIYKGIHDDTLIGMYSLIIWENQLYLEHIFIDPASLHHGFGTELLNHAKRTVKTLGFSELDVMVDPHAKGFYEKSGGIWMKDIASNIPGRSIPYYRFHI